MSRRKQQKIKAVCKAVDAQTLIFPHHAHLTDDLQCLGLYKRHQARVSLPSSRGIRAWSLDWQVADRAHFAQHAVLIPSRGKVYTKSAA